MKHEFVKMYEVQFVAGITQIVHECAQCGFLIYENSDMPHIGMLRLFVDVYNPCERERLRLVEHILKL